MKPLFVLAVLLGVPVAELYVFVQMTHAMGFFPSLLVLAAVSVIGAWLVKHQGLRVWRRFQQQVHAGVVPERELADGMLLLVAGALLLAPGFITDALGALLLLPPVRSLARRLMARRRRTTVITATHTGSTTRPVNITGVIEASSEERD